VGRKDVEETKTQSARLSSKDVEDSNEEEDDEREEDKKLDPA